MVKVKSTLAVIIIFISFVYCFQGCISSKQEPISIPTNTPEPEPTPIPTPTEDPQIYLINPGKGIAYIEINKSNTEEVKKWFKEDVNEGEDQGYIKLFYKNSGLTFWFDSKSKILKALLIENKSYETPEEIKLGSTVFKAQDKYNKGVLDLEKRIYFCDDGTDYYYNEIGEIIKIYISQRDPVPTPTPTPYIKTMSPSNISKENAEIIRISALKQNKVLIIYLVGISFCTGGITDQYCPKCKMGSVQTNIYPPGLYCHQCDWKLSMEEARKEGYKVNVDYCCPKCGKQFAADSEGFHCLKCDYSLSIDELREQNYIVSRVGDRCPECKSYFSIDNNGFHCNKCNYFLSMKNIREKGCEIFWPQR